MRTTTQNVNAEAEKVYRCQATQALEASTHISGFDPRQYVTDVRSGNVGGWTVVKGLAVLAFNKYQGLSVERKVERIIDERTGLMRKLRDCYVLESVICTGFLRKFCQREVPMYWRSAWLHRVHEPGPTVPTGR